MSICVETVKPRPNSESIPPRVQWRERFTKRWEFDRAIAMQGEINVNAWRLSRRSDCFQEKCSRLRRCTRSRVKSVRVIQTRYTFLAELECQFLKECGSCQFLMGVIQEWQHSSQKAGSMCSNYILPRRRYQLKQTCRYRPR